jgi:hypothetical protein
MCTINRPVTRTLFVVLVVTALFGLLAAAGLAQADGASLYHKSRLGLMPPAYTAGESRLSLQAAAASGVFQPHVIYPSGSWPEVVAGGDFTGDGRTDAALSTSFDWDAPNDNRVHLFAQTASGVLTRTQRVAAGGNPSALARGDFNRDGRPDLVVANQDEDTLGVLLQSGGALSAMITYTAGVGPDGVAVGDFNGDLRDDVAVSHAVSQSVAIYFQQADGTLAAPAYLDVSSAGFNDTAAGDINGDGWDDLVLLRGAGHGSDQVAIFYQQSHALGAPVYRTAEDGGFLPHGLAVGDVTGDGRDDVVVTAGGNVPQAYLNVFPQKSSGTLAITPTVYAAYHLPEAVEVGDVNHDGRNDVVLVHAGWMSLSVYTQTVSGTLSAYESYPLPYADSYRPGGLVLADVSGDGGLDALVASHSSVAAENGLVVLDNSGDAPTSTITVPAPGTYVTNTASFQIEGTASTASGTLEVSTDGGRTWDAQPVATNWTYTWTLPVTDGSTIVLARVTDATGRVQSPPARTRVIVDRIPPTGSLAINEGAACTIVATVTLTLDAQDATSGVCQVQIRNGGAAWGGWQPFTHIVAWDLGPGMGERIVEARFRDCALNESVVVSDSTMIGPCLYMPVVVRNAP